MTALAKQKIGCRDAQLRVSTADFVLSPSWPQILGPFCQGPAFGGILFRVFDSGF